MEEFSDVTASHRQLTASIKQGTPTDVALEELGEKIAENWKKLGRRLDINEPKLQEIHEAHDQLSERGYYMLRHWKQEKGSAATYQALCDALQHNLVQRQDLAEQFCYIHGTCAIQLPAGPVSEEKETGRIPVATAATCEIEASSKDQEDFSRVRSGLKRKNLEPTPERGNLSFKTKCASAISRNSEEQDPQQARKKVNRYMEDKVDEAKRTFDLSSYKGLNDLHAYLVGHLHLWIERFENGSLKITVKCDTLEILEQLLDDYYSGHLNAVAEECLITEKVKDELDMETITLKTTILYEDYLACKLSLTEISAEACADDGQVELRGDLESREHELKEHEKPTAFALEEQTELGLKHADVGSTCSNFIGELQQANEHYERALDIRRKELVAEHVDVASMYLNLGNVQYDLDDLKRAKESYELALGIILKKHGPDHVDVARTYNNIGIVLHDLGDLQQAKKYYKRALAIQLKKLGPDHIDFARTRNNLGTVQRDLGDLQQAKKHYKHALAIRLKTLGPDHVDVGRTYNNLGIVLHGLGDLKQAKKNYELALDIRLKKLGPDHLDVATTYNNLGVVQHALGDLQQAKKHYKRALYIQLIKLGPDHVDVARTYFNLGKVQLDLDDLQQAKEHYKHALAIRLKKLGPDHLDVAATYNNLGVVQHALGDLQQAKKHYKRALYIQLIKLGPDHVDVARTYLNLGKVQHDLGDLQEAQLNYKCALNIQLQKLGPGHVDVARTYNYLGKIKRASPLLGIDSGVSSPMSTFEK